VLDNIDYVANLVGVDHVGVGSDINENFRAMPMLSAWEAVYMTDPKLRARWLPDFCWFDHYPNVTAGLVQRGYSDEDVKKIMGGNFLRVAETAWKERR
jgi:membrane dipeptidase